MKDPAMGIVGVISFAVGVGMFMAALDTLLTRGFGSGAALYAGGLAGLLLGVWLLGIKNS